MAKRRLSNRIPQVPTRSERFFPMAPPSSLPLVPTAKWGPRAAAPSVVRGPHLNLWDCLSTRARHRLRPERHRRDPLLRLTVVASASAFSLGSWHAPCRVDPPRGGCSAHDTPSGKTRLRVHRERAAEAGRSSEQLVFCRRVCFRERHDSLGNAAGIVDFRRRIEFSVWKGTLL